MRKRKRKNREIWMMICAVGFAIARPKVQPSENTASGLAEDMSRAWRSDRMAMKNTFQIWGRQGLVSACRLFVCVVCAFFEVSVRRTWSAAAGPKQQQLAFRREREFNQLDCYQRRHVMNLAPMHLTPLPHEKSIQSDHRCHIKWTAQAVQLLLLGLFIDEHNHELTIQLNPPILSLRLLRSPTLICTYTVHHPNLSLCFIQTLISWPQ